MFAQGGDGGEGVWERFGPGDPSALRVLALSTEDARRTVAVLRGSPQPVVDGLVDSLRSRRDRLGELVEATRGPDRAGVAGADEPEGADVGRCLLPGTGGRSAPTTRVLRGIVESFSAFSAECASWSPHSQG